LDDDDERMVPGFLIPTMENWRSNSFKVIDFCCNRKPTYDFLLAINCHLSSISHRFRNIASWSRSKTTLPSFEPSIKGLPWNFIKLDRQRADTLGYIFVKTAWSWLQPFCHNTLASWQTISYGNSGTCNALQRSAKTHKFWNKNKLTACFYTSINEKTQKRSRVKTISRIRGSITPKRIVMKFCIMVGLPDVVTREELDGDRFDHFCVVGRGSNFRFSHW